MPWIVTKQRYDEAMDMYRQVLNQLMETQARLAEAQRFAANALALLKQPHPPVDPQLNATIQPASRQLQLPVAKADEIAEAIELAAGSDTALARHLGRWSKKQKMDGAHEQDIINSILHWKTADVWDGDVSDVPFRGM